MCILKAFSRDHSFKDFAESTPMPVFRSREKGETRYAGSSKVNERFSISFNVSTKEWDDFKGQVEDAISFLRQWEFEISQFALQYPPDLFYLDFPLYSRLDDEIICQGDYLPAELISLAGKVGLGVEMSIYSREV